MSKIEIEQLLGEARRALSDIRDKYPIDYRNINWILGVELKKQTLKDAINIIDSVFDLSESGSDDGN